MRVRGGGPQNISPPASENLSEEPGIHVRNPVLRTPTRMVNSVLKLLSLRMPGGNTPILDLHHARPTDRNLQHQGRE